MAAHTCDHPLHSIQVQRKRAEALQEHIFIYFYFALIFMTQALREPRLVSNLLSPRDGLELLRHLTLPPEC